MIIVVTLAVCPNKLFLTNTNLTRFVVVGRNKGTRKDHRRDALFIYFLEKVTVTFGNLKIPNEN